MKRLPRQLNERLDRTQPLTFTWRDKRYQAFVGDTLASALLANNIKIVGRSFKYGRHRGVLDAGVAEPNALATIENYGFHTPNARATEVEMYERLAAHPATGKPSLQFDIRAFMAPFHRFMAAGFYYKTFKWPASLWPWYEKRLRSFTGFSKAPAYPDSETYDRLHHHVDVLVVGAGIAGITAALECAAQGCRVLILEHRSYIGGECLLDVSTQADVRKAFATKSAALYQHQHIEVLTSTTAYALFDANLVHALELRHAHLPLIARKKNQSSQRVHKIRAQYIVLAAGAHERPMMFANNDTPGSMLVSAARRYAHMHAVLVGDAPVIYGNNDSIYAAAKDFMTMNVIPIVIDVRTGYDAHEIEEQGAVVWQGYAITGIKRAQHAVAGIRVSQIEFDGDSWNINHSAHHNIPCNVLLHSGGFNPVVHLDCHTGSKPVYDAQIRAFVPTNDSADRCVTGSANGLSDWRQCMDDGSNAARKALTMLGKHPSRAKSIHRTTLNVADFIYSGKNKNIFVDMQNDVTVDDMKLAIRENYQSIEHIKRYTTLGFGTDQGKTGNVNGVAIAADTQGLSMSEIGTTTFRPNYTPVALGALAAEDATELFAPSRLTPIHEWHMQLPVEWENVGQWKRPFCYPQPGETQHDAVQRECMALRTGVAMTDASTLGKITIFGPDARELLARVYTNNWAKLAPGSCRYGVMCDENGMIFDDGVTSCIDDEHFIMTTTTGGALHVFLWLESWLQQQWSELQVYVTSATDHWSTIGLGGPKSRKVIQKVCDDIDFSPEKFSFMQWRQGTVAGVAARVMQISFSGELTYEVNVQANYARGVWEAIYAAAEEFAVTSYGTEAAHVLRAEKGFVIVGQDTDGTATPFDMNMGWAVNMNKPYPFLGQRSLMRSDTARTGRKQLVGLLPNNETTVVPEGAQLVNGAFGNAMIGHVTSSYYSAILGHPIALAMVADGLERIGDTVYARHIGSENPVAMTLVDSVFYDKNRERINGEV